MIYVAFGLFTVVIVALIGLILLQSLQHRETLRNVFSFTDDTLSRGQHLVEQSFDRLMATNFDQYKGWQSVESQVGSVSEPEEEGIQVSPGAGLWGGTIPTAGPVPEDEETQILEAERESERL